LTRAGALARAQALDAEHATLHLAGRCDTVALKVFRRVRAPLLLRTLRTAARLWRGRQGHALAQPPSPHSRRIRARQVPIDACYALPGAAAGGETAVMVHSASKKRWYTLTTPDEAYAPLWHASRARLHAAATAARAAAAAQAEKPLLSFDLAPGFDDADDLHAAAGSDSGADAAEATALPPGFVAPAHAYVAARAAPPPPAAAPLLAPGFDEDDAIDAAAAAEAADVYPPGFMPPPDEPACSGLSTLHDSDAAADMPAAARSCSDLRVLDGRSDDDDSAANSADAPADAGETDPQCCICDDGGAMLECEGGCRRSVCEECCETYLGIGGAAFAALATSAQPWRCAACVVGRHRCFECGVAGSTVADAADAAPPALFKCGVLECTRFYHPRCVPQALRRQNGVATPAPSPPGGHPMAFTCAQHACRACGDAAEPGKRNGMLVPCRRCPDAYHKRCLPVALATASPQRVWLSLRDGGDAQDVVNTSLLYCLAHSMDVPAAERHAHAPFPPALLREARGCAQRAAGGACGTPPKRKRRAPPDDSD
jgi:hypothetical protein